MSDAFEKIVQEASEKLDSHDYDFSLLSYQDVLIVLSALEMIEHSPNPIAMLQISFILNKVTDTDMMSMGFVEAREEISNVAKAFAEWINAQ